MSRPRVTQHDGWLGTWLLTALPMEVNLAFNCELGWSIGSRSWSSKSTSKRNVGSYMTIDWTLYFIRWSTLNLTRWALSENECSIGAPMLVPRQGEMPSYPYEPGCESRMLVRDSLLTPGMDNTRHFYSITAVSRPATSSIGSICWLTRSWSKRASWRYNQQINVIPDPIDDLVWIKYY